MDQSQNRTIELSHVGEGPAITGFIPVSDPVSATAIVVAGPLRVKGGTL